MLVLTRSLIDSLRSSGCVFAEQEAELLLEAATSPSELSILLARRLAGEPIEHIVGWAAFCGLRILLDDGAFVPRLRTEFLAHQAISNLTPRAVVVDLCCGSGAVGAAMLAADPLVELHAADIDPVEVACARRNLPGPVYEGDLLSPLPEHLRGRVDLVLASCPYVPTGAIRLLPAEARLHEPRVSLDGGEDGLDVVRRIVREAPDWLSATGSLLLETSERQAPVVLADCGTAGLTGQILRCEDRDATVVVARR